MVYACNGFFAILWNFHLQHSGILICNFRYFYLTTNTQENSAEKLLNIIEEKDRRIAELEQQVRWLMSQIRLTKHKQFGASREKTDSFQLSLFNEAESIADMTVPEPKLTQVKSHYRKRTRLTTDKLPKDLPVEVIEHELPVEDLECSGLARHAKAFFFC
jgi:transposase